MLGAFLVVLTLLGCASTANRKQQSLNEWRGMTSPTAPVPRVFVKGDQVRFYFQKDGGVDVFKALWRRLRVPTGAYRVNSAILRWDQRMSRIPEHEHGWREATVIAGNEWRAISTNLLKELTPETSGHGAYYQAFLSDRLLYRDFQGIARSAPEPDVPEGITIEHRFTLEETLERMAHGMEAQLTHSHPSDSLFLLMAPNAKHFAQPVLLDRRQRQCVFLAPAALFDSNERGLTLNVTAQGLSAALPEAHGIALLKNPISSAARLADLAVQTVVRFVRFPLPKPGTEVPPLLSREGMDLAEWETWLDDYTGTRREPGQLRLLIDGEQFFPRLQQVIEQATNHLHWNIYVFDRDDIAVGIADLLKRRSKQIDIKIIFDRLGTLGAGASPPATPLPEDFVPPSSIGPYLTKGSRVQVRTFLNPWFSSDHSKVLLADGSKAFLGGMNIGRKYRYEWHDLMVEVEGPIVGSLETAFQRDWAHAGPLGDLAYGAVLLGNGPTSAAEGGSTKLAALRLLPTKTAWKPFATAVLGSLRRARNYVYVENPYLFDKRVILALVRARQRGVDVRVILPCVNDFKAGGRSNLVIANYLLERGVRVYFYPGMTHVKALLVDDWACVGSGNLNHLSLRVNQEQNIGTSDPNITVRIKRELFEADFARSYKLSEPVSIDWIDSLADLVLEGF